MTHVPIKYWPPHLDKSHLPAAAIHAKLFFESQRAFQLNKLRDQAVC